MFYLLIVVAVVSRLVPHPPNLVCIGALGLFAGCYMNRRVAWLIPCGAMLASDLIGQVLKLPGLGFYSPITMATVYVGFGVSACMGRSLRHQASPWRIAVAAGSTSVMFFLLSNFGVWLSGLYPSTASGLVSCYVMAMPFFPNTLAGDLLYSVVLFGGYHLICEVRSTSSRPLSKRWNAAP